MNDGQSEMPDDSGDSGRSTGGHGSARRSDGPRGALDIVRRIDRALGVTEQAMLALLLLVLIAVGSVQAVANQLFNQTFQWSEQILRYAVFFIAMLGAALSAHTERLIAMDFVSRQLSPSRRALVRQVLRLFTIAACLAIIVASIGNYETLGLEAHSGVIPSDLGSLALPIGAGLIALHVLLHMITDVTYLARGATPPEEGGQSLH